MMTKKFLLPLILVSVVAASITADDLAVTVYNSNLGVVSETRQLEFSKGVGQLAFRDVPARIDPSSVRFEIVGQDRKVTILEQNYAFDLVSPEQLYAKYVDNQIEMIDKEGHLYAGKLLAYSSGSVTLLEESGKVKIVTMANIAEVNFPALPEGLITRPTLFWLYNSDFSGDLDCRVGYQTSGMIWKAEYVGLLDDSDSRLSLSGWASIDNTSGKTYEDARLKLIAGDIHRAAQPPAPKKTRLMAMADEAGAGFEEKAFFEYHMYTLPRKATIANKEIKQISLFEPSETSVKKTYLYQPDRNSRNVSVKVEFTNSSDDGLGMPLPAGRVRLFKADTDGSLILLGEDWIQHTPKDEKLSLTVGNAFDIVGEQKMISQHRISDKVDEREWEIEIRNRKDSDITVKIEKKLWGFWEIIDSNLAHEKKDSSTVVFTMPVSANGTGVLKLRVRFTTR